MPPSRSHAAGRHFRLLEKILAGEQPRENTEALKDLMRWNYVMHAGTEYAATAEGRRVFDAWDGIEQV